MALLKRNVSWLGPSAALLLTVLFWSYSRSGAALPAAVPAAVPASPALPTAAALPAAAAVPAAAAIPEPGFSPKPVAVQETYEPLDAGTASSIATLRRDAALDDDALAVLNLTAERLETLLSALRNWHTSNATTLTQRRAALADAQALVRHYQSLLNSGQAVAESLAQAKAAVTAAQSSLAALSAACRTAVLSGLSAQERTLADLLHTRRAKAMPYRVLALDTSQDNAVQKALTIYHQRIGIAGAADAAQAAADMASAIAAAIGASGTQTLASLAGYRPAAAERVVAAVQLVLAEAGH